MHLRRTTVLSVASLLLAAPMLSSCGFDYATDRPYTPGAGTNDRDGSVDVLSASIVSAEEDSGTFIAGLSNNDQEKPVDFESMSGAAGNTLQFEAFSPRAIEPGGFLNLSQDGVPVTGTFRAGEVVPVSLTFSNGERVTMDVTVVADDGYYAGFDQTAPDAASESAAPETPNEVASSGAQGSQSSSPSSSPTE